MMYECFLLTAGFALFPTLVIAMVILADVFHDWREVVWPQGNREHLDKKRRFLEVWLKGVGGVKTSQLLEAKIRLYFLKKAIIKERDNLYVSSDDREQ